jgi:uncharacterized protein (DUF58 family)
MNTQSPHPTLADSGLALPPDLRARLADIEIRARRSLHSAAIGQQASRSRGSGIEFAQYRSYEPGDDPRTVDWKLYARSDRYFVREAERDSPLTLWLLLDGSASMGQADRADPRWTRLHAARRLAACALEIALRQGDSVGLILATPRPQALPAARGPRQRDRCLRALAALEAEGVWPAPDALLPLLQRIDPGALVLVLGDLFDDATRSSIQQLAHAGREVACVQLICADEREFPYRGALRFVDPETGAAVECDADAARDGFLARFEAARKTLAAQLAGAGISHVEHAIGEPADRPLRALFGRAAAAGGGTEVAGR